MEAEAEPSQDQRAEDGEEDADSETSSAEAFCIKWGWTINIDRVSEVTRASWDAVTDYPIYQFLNILAYANDRANIRKQSNGAGNKVG